MIKLILNHYRRWSWVLVCSAALEFALGWFIATGPKFDFEFWSFLLALWAGPTLLSFDLKRGLLRCVATLPLTGRQIGRGWWLATVPIPAIALAVLLFSGAATFCHFHPGREFPAGRLAMASLFTLAWLGMSFNLVFNATRGFGANGREFICNSLVNILAPIAFFASMLFCNGASKDPFKSALLLGGGMLFTLLGWVRAEQFEPGRAGLYLGRIEPPRLGRGGLRLTPLEPKILSSQCPAPGGCGGVPLLLRTTFIKAFFPLLFMVLLIALLLHWRFQDIATLLSFLCGWFIVVQIMPLLRQLRSLRTLPISASRLALLLLAIALLPLIALGALVSGLAGLYSGASVARTLLNGYTFNLAPVAFCVFFLIWQGSGKLAYVLAILTLFGFFMGGLWVQTSFHHKAIPFHLACPIAAIAIILAFLLTRRALQQSSRPYLAQANPSGPFPWVQAR